MNRIYAQAQALFEARLSDLLHATAIDINGIKRECNERGILSSSITVRRIFERVEGRLVEMATFAEQCAVLSFEAMGLSIDERIQAELLDAFELSLGSGYQKLVALADSETLQIRKALSNDGLFEWRRLPEVVKGAQLAGQANLRKYYQDNLRKKKKWYEFLPLISWASRVFFGH